MKRLTILGIIACVGLVFAPAAVLGAPAGPPVEWQVHVVNEAGVAVVNDDSNPVPVIVQTVYRFAGFSTTTTNGDAGGIGGMHSICQTDLNDTSARMCTTEELLLSPNIPAAGLGYTAWVQPKIVSTVIDAGLLLHCDYTGICFSRQSANCYGWGRSDNEARGIVFNGYTGGVVASQDCDHTYRVTCCTPAN